MYWLSTRAYNPDLRRFVSPDDISYLGANGDLLGYNMYACCSNDPVNCVDPSGHFGIFVTILISTLVGAFIGGGLSVVGQAIEQVAEHGLNFSNWNEFDWGKVVSDTISGAVSGLTYGLGGVAGGMVTGSFSTIASLTVTESLAMLLGVAAITGFGGGITASYVESKITGEDFTWSKGITKGLNQAGKSSSNFVVGGLFVLTGMWKVGAGVYNSMRSTYIINPSVKFALNYHPNGFFDEKF